MKGHSVDVLRMATVTWKNLQIRTFVGQVEQRMNILSNHICREELVDIFNNRHLTPATYLKQDLSNKQIKSR